MKALQRLCTTAALILTLGVSAFAGHIPIPENPPPPAPVSATTSGEIPIGVATEDTDSANSLLEEIVLDLLQTVLSAY